MNSPGLWKALFHLLFILPSLRSQYRIVGSRQRSSSSKMDVINRINEMHTKDYGKMKLQNDLKIKGSLKNFPFDILYNINSHIMQWLKV